MKQDDSLPRRRSRSFVQQISPPHLLLLKAALLDGDAAMAAYRAWRPTLDLDTISYGQQRLLPLLQSNLTRLGIEDPLADRFRGIRRYFWVRNLKAMAFARQVFATLDQIGVPFIVLKGTALVACRFVDRSLRPMDDIDILVPQDRVAETIAVLTAMNLRPKGASFRPFMLNSRLFPAIAGWPFVGTDKNIDLHWKALHLDLRPEADDRFWEGHREANLDGMPIRVLNPADQIIHICAHAAQPYAGAAIEQWPADAILVIRANKDLCVERLVSEATHRGLSAIIAEGLDFLVREFNVSIPNTAISRMRAAASWERAEMRLLLVNARKATRMRGLLLKLLEFRRKSPGSASRSMARILPAFVKNWAGVDQITPALIVAVQAMLGRPRWLRRILGRDRYRILPEVDRLPKVGSTLKLGGPDFDEETALLRGWSHPLPTGRWAMAEATVAWCVRGQHQDLTLLIDGVQALHEPPQRIELWANDRCVASWRSQMDLVSQQPTRVLLPRDLIRNSDVLMLTFLIRCSCLHFRSLTLKVESPLAQA